MLSVGRGFDVWRVVTVRICDDFWVPAVEPVQGVQPGVE
jgi:hypothetical protein